MRQLPAVAADRLGVFSLSEALATGWTMSALRNAVRQERLHRLRPGVFWTPAPEPADQFAAEGQRLVRRAFAAALANPSSTVSHGAGAALHGLTRWRSTETPCLTVLPHFVGDIEQAHLHRAKLPDGHLSAVHGVNVTTVARTVIDVAREEGTLSAVVTADAALRLQRVDRQTLRARVRECAGWPGVRAARQAIECADGRAESALESASRFLLQGRVPRPEPQARIFDTAGVFLGRADFLWEQFGVVGEADGLEKYDAGNDPKRLSLRDEKVRQEGFERVGLIVVRWMSTDLSDIGKLAARLGDAFAAGARATGPRRWRAVPTQPPGFAPFSAAI
jgi:hypothetical protein